MMFIPLSRGFLRECCVLGGATTGEEKKSGVIEGQRGREVSYVYVWGWVGCVWRGEGGRDPMGGKRRGMRKENREMKRHTRRETRRDEKQREKAKARINASDVA
jgi:hypothetical protein